MVICRSGYSTVMDLAALKTNAILIPTQGQSEQEYLATHLMNSRIFYSCKQKNLDLLKELEKARSFYTNASMPEVFFNNTPIQNWVDALQQRRLQQ
jgi:UDP-N-acetylglucosamine:LPS N-acetylglucosamine transferase